MSSGDGATSEEDTTIAMKLTIKSIKTRFPKVSTVDTKAVSNLLQTQTKGLILLDVREKPEYDVSHIEGALRVSPDMDDMATVVASTQDLFTDDTRIVCYCSLGYRSSAYANSLFNWLERERSKRGITMLPTVYNMEGSLFKWANEKRPMVNDSGKTVCAHPYNYVFGKLLNKELRQTEVNK